MREYLQVWRAQVPDDKVERLLEVRPAAIAEAKQLCPELLSAELVRLEDGSWLDVLRWSEPDGEERLMKHQDRFEAVLVMHALLDEPVQLGRGAVVMTS